MLLKISGNIFHGETPDGVVRCMANLAKTDAVGPYMAKVQLNALINGIEVSTESPNSFIASLIAAGLAEVVQPIDPISIGK